MPHETSRERRQPRIDVHHLRRDLRDADEDRYQLRTELDRQRTGRGPSHKLLGLVALVAGGLTSVLWMTLPAAQRMVRIQPAGAAVPALAQSSASGQDFILPVELAAAEALPRTRVSSRRIAVMPGGRTRAAETSAAVPAASRGTERDSRPTATVSNRRDQPRGSQRSERDEKAPRRRPRPLSPGEFGRQATL